MKFLAAAARGVLYAIVPLYLARGFALSSRPSWLHHVAACAVTFALVMLVAWKASGGEDRNRTETAR